MNKTIQGHLMALIAVLIWGMTFIASKVLVASWTPTGTSSSASAWPGSSFSCSPPSP